MGNHARSFLDLANALGTAEALERFVDAHVLNEAHPVRKPLVAGLAILSTTSHGDAHTAVLFEGLFAGNVCVAFGAVKIRPF